MGVMWRCSSSFIVLIDKVIYRCYWENSNENLCYRMRRCRRFLWCWRKISTVAKFSFLDVEIRFTLCCHDMNENEIYSANIVYISGGGEEKAWNENLITVEKKLTENVSWFNFIQLQCEHTTFSLVLIHSTYISHLLSCSLAAKVNNFN